MATTAAQTHFVDGNDDARKTIDEEIARLEAQIVSLKLSRNALAPINRLHPEVLQEILLFAHNSSNDWKKGEMTLLITWICRHWRELAHYTAALWSHIDFRHPAWIDASLVRAKNHGLAVELNTARRKPKYDLAPLIPLTLGNISRTETLKVVSPLCLRPAFHISSYERAWLIPAPILTHLHLHGLALPDNLFSKIFPQLMTLHITDCNLEWDALPVRLGMSELIVDDIRPRVSVENVVKTLQIVAPELRVLHLGSLFAQEDSSDTHTTSTRIQFEKLTKLELDDTDPDMFGQLFNRISFPKHGMLMNITAQQWPEANFFHALVSARDIGRWPTELLQVKIREKSIKLCLDEDWRTREGSVSKTRKEDVTYIQVEAMTHKLPSRLGDIFNSLPIHPLGTVYFTGGSYQPQELTLLDHLGKSRTAEHLCIEAPFLTSFEAWVEEQDEKLRQIVQKEGELDQVIDKELIAAAQKTMGYPNLRSLEVFGDSTKASKFTCNHALTVRKWLGWRDRVGFKVETFALTDMSVPSFNWMNGLYAGVVTNFVRSGATERSSIESGAAQS